MSAADSEGYILNQISNPRPMRIVWASIDRGQTTDEELKVDTELSADQISAAMAGLRYLRLIEVTNGYSTVPLKFGDVAATPQLNFSLTALSHIMEESTPPNWSKQAVVPLTLQYFIETNTQFFNRRDGGLVEKIDSWHRDQGFQPVDRTGSTNKMNDRKLQNWTFIAEYFGFVRNVSGTDYTVYLDPELLWTLLQEAVKELPDQSGTTTSYPAISIREWFNWLSESFFPVSLTTDMEIPTIMAETLSELSREGRIRLVEAGDQGALGLQGLPQLETMDAETNAIEVRI